VHLRNGMQHFAAPERAARTGPVRFGYIGSLHPHKGVELLLRAFLGLRGEASLHVHGSAFHSPVSHSYWSRIRSAANSGHIHFHGAYQNDQVREILAGLDVVVVPSLWYENSPLTIQEAFLAAVPVITAGEGGMAEQVQHGRNGLHFRLGDVADLRARLQQVVDRPELIAELRQGIPPVPDMREHAAAVLQLYHSLRQPAVGV
jgi:glycosyltransferase involved in cell wall biosynthesis